MTNKKEVIAKSNQNIENVQEEKKIFNQKKELSYYIKVLLKIFEFSNKEKIDKNKLFREIFLKEDSKKSTVSLFDEFKKLKNITTIKLISMAIYVSIRYIFKSFFLYVASRLVIITSNPYNNNIQEFITPLKRIPRKFLKKWNNDILFRFLFPKNRNIKTPCLSLEKTGIFIYNFKPIHTPFTNIKNFFKNLCYIIIISFIINLLVCYSAVDDFFLLFFENILKRINPNHKIYFIYTDLSAAFFANLKAAIFIYILINILMQLLLGPMLRSRRTTKQELYKRYRSRIIIIIVYIYSMFFYFTYFIENSIKYYLSYQKFLNENAIPLYFEWDYSHFMNHLLTDLIFFTFIPQYISVLYWLINYFPSYINFFFSIRKIMFFIFLFLSIYLAPPYIEDFCRLFLFLYLPYEFLFLTFSIKSYYYIDEQEKSFTITGFILKVIDRNVYDEVYPIVTEESCGAPIFSISNEFNRSFEKS